MKFSYSIANLIFFGFLIILLILPIFDRHKISKFQTQKSLLGIRLWAITFLPIKRARCLPQITAIKFLGNLAEKIFERQTKATLEVKARHFVTTFEGGQINKNALLARFLKKLYAIEQYWLDSTYLHFFCLIISLTMSPLAVESLILTGGQCLTAFGSHVSKPQVQNLLPIGFTLTKEQNYRRWLT